MRPAGRVWKRDGRRTARRQQEPQLRQQPTRRQREQALVSDAEDMLARQAHIDAGWELPFLLNGMPGVTVIILGEGS